jgi:hypothetical protein
MSTARAVGPIDASNAVRFWTYVDVRTEDECWLWRGCITSGYGEFRIYKGMVKAHRVSFAIANGGVPQGRLICHTCDIPLCVNPRHLFCGTVLDNARDSSRKGRRNKSKFSRADVEAMRAMREAGAWYRLIAARYGISVGHVRGLLHGDIRLKDE